MARTPRPTVLSALEPVRLRTWKVRTWTDVWLVYLVSGIVLAGLSLLPLQRVTFDHATENGSVHYEASIRLGGSHASSELDDDDPEGQDTLRALEAVDLSGDQMSFVLAVGLFLFAIPRTRWSRGLKILAALSWLVALDGLRPGFGRAIGGDPLRDLVHVEWQGGVWVMVAIGVGLVASVLYSYRPGAVHGEPANDTAPPETH